MRCATPIQCYVVGHLTVDDAPCLRDRVHPADVGKVVAGGILAMAWVWFLVVSMWAIAEAHTPEELDTWRAEWTVRVQEAGGISPDLLAEWVDMRDRHSCDWPGTECVYLDPEPRISSQTVYGVEQWRSLVSLHFPPENVDAALRVISCESHGNPSAANPRSSARGLFQFLEGWWSGAWGYPAFDPFDPEANVRAAAWLSDGGTDWSHWVCRP